MDFLGFLLRRQPLVELFLAVPLAGLAWFGFGLLRGPLWFPDPAHQNQDLVFWVVPRGGIVQMKALQPDHTQPSLKQGIADLDIPLQALQTRFWSAKAHRRGGKA